MKYHEIAKALPQILGDEREKLKQDILEKGVLEPIKLWDGEILDGRTRWEISQELGIKCPTEDVHPKDEVEALGLSVSLNERRRHLSSGQLAAVAVAHKEMYAKYLKRLGRDEPEKVDSEDNGDEANGHEEKEALKGRKSKEAVSTLVGTNPTYMYKAEKLKDDHPAEFKKVLSGEKSLTQALRDVSEPKEKVKDAAVLDAGKQAVPEDYEKVFADRAKFAAINSHLLAAKKGVEELDNRQSAAYLDQIEVKSQINNARKALKQSQPHSICPSCSGDKQWRDAEGKKCGTCKGRGWVNLLLVKALAKGESAEEDEDSDD